MMRPRPNRAFTLVELPFDGLRAVRKGKRAAFTLIELLVVIAIIMILIALLIGPLTRARRGALVLACPIAATGANGAMVLLHPHGGAELEIGPPTGSWTFGPYWSANGTWIGYVRDMPAQHVSQTVIVHAMNGKVRQYDGLMLLGWADDDHFIVFYSDSEVRRFELREATTGRSTESFPSSSGTALPITRVPPSTGAYYITADGPNGQSRVVLLRRDFSIKKVIYGVNTSSESPLWGARVDPMGEYAAWFGGVGGIGGVCIKSLKAPTSAKPEVVVPPPGYSIIFADWTEDGNLLGYAPANGISIGRSPGERGAKLVVLKRSGMPLQTIQVFDPLVNSPHPLSANYRIYRHQ